MTTTKRDIMKKIQRRKDRENGFRRELAKHIPDLWKYAKTIQPAEDKAYALLSNTISSAMMLQDQKHLDADYETLSRLMYIQYLQDMSRSETDPKPYIFAAPTRANLIKTMSGQTEKCTRLQ